MLEGGLFIFYFVFIKENDSYSMSRATSLWSTRACNAIVHVEDGGGTMHIGDLFKDQCTKRFPDERLFFSARHLRRKWDKALTGSSGTAQGKVRIGSRWRPFFSV